MRDHPKLRAFELAEQLAVAIYKATRSFPREERFGLTSQLRRATVSVASNIVEGSARFSEAEYLHFLDIAYGSAREVEYQAGLASRLRFLAEPSHRELGALSLETCKVLNGLRIVLWKTGSRAGLYSAAASSRPGSMERK